MPHIGSWNTRGLNNPRKLRSVHNWVCIHHLDIIGIIETKVSFNNLTKVEDNLNLTGWNFFSNVSPETPCRILVGWNTATYNLTNFHQSPQWVTCDAYSSTTKTTTHLFHLWPQ